MLYGASLLWNLTTIHILQLSNHLTEANTDMLGREHNLPYLVYMGSTSQQPMDSELVELLHRNSGLGCASQDALTEEQALHLILRVGHLNDPPPHCTTHHIY